jgi:hypothetical protein
MIIVSTEALTLASKKGSETVSSPDQHNTRTSNSLWCPHSLSECRKITCKSLMLLSVTLVTVIAVWSTLCTLSTFYAIPKQGVVSLFDGWRSDNAVNCRAPSRTEVGKQEKQMKQVRNTRVTVLCKRYIHKGVW